MDIALLLVGTHGIGLPSPGCWSRYEEMGL